MNQYEALDMYEKEREKAEDFERMFKTSQEINKLLEVQNKSLQTEVSNLKSKLCHSVTPKLPKAEEGSRDKIGKIVYTVTYSGYYPDAGYCIRQTYLREIRHTLTSRGEEKIEYITDIKGEPYLSIIAVVFSRQEAEKIKKELESKNNS